ncbi:hypothetical protein C4J81_00665 [Deltaproteobacteria bacterium Smac51]|nr:hypothetical protein C4J81_00665 [Deltaproteobacteria bacterium Smac51]
MAFVVFVRKWSSNPISFQCSKPLPFQPEPENYDLPAAPASLTTEFFSHLWPEAQAHNIIGTIDGQHGEKLRENGPLLMSLSIGAESF